MNLFKIYKSLQRNQFSLKPNIKVIILVEPSNLIFAEFSKSTQIFSIKKYIEKYLNTNKFELLFNGIILKCDLYLDELCYNNSNGNRIFLKVIKNKNKFELLREYKNDIINYEEKNKNLNNELLKVKKENDNKEYSNKIIEQKYKNINAIYLRKKIEIDELKKKLQEINEDINIINMKERKKRNKRKYSMENRDNFELKTFNNVLKKSNAIIYSINGRNYNSKNYNRTNINKKFTYSKY